jgi:thymidylate synthase (FAD)
MVNLVDMKLIKPSYEILPQSSGLDGMYKQIEIAGRTCYKSSDKITPDSAKGFVERMIASNHGAMLEHGTVYLDIPPENWIIADNYKNSKYSIVRMGEHFYSVTTNYRVLVENNWLDDLQYQCEPTEFHERRISVKFILDRGVSHEFVRHKLLCVA